jgi:hypothetical protein
VRQKLQYIYTSFRHQMCDRFFFEYYGFVTSASFQHCSTLVHSSTTDAIYITSGVTDPLNNTVLPSPRRSFIRGAGNAVNKQSCCEMFVVYGLNRGPLQGGRVHCIGTALQLWRRVALHTSAVQLL